MAFMPCIRKTLDLLSRAMTALHPQCTPFVSHKHVYVYLCSTAQLPVQQHATLSYTSHPAH